MPSTQALGTFIEANDDLMKGKTWVDVRSSNIPFPHPLVPRAQFCALPPWLSIPVLPSTSGCWESCPGGTMGTSDRDRFNPNDGSNWP
jgi:hypothetical protein